MKALAVDLGATSAKIHLVTFEGKGIRLEEIGRFETKGMYLPTKERKVLVWNLPKFLEEIESVVENTKADSISFDSWGVDFTLLDEKGRMLFLPYHYRDERTKGVMDKALHVLNAWEVYKITGIQFMPINTIYQLYSMVLEGDSLLKVAKAMLMVANVFTYWFSGEVVNEYTLASTTQMMDAEKKNWATDLIQKLGIPLEILTEIVDPGTILGGKPKVIAGASHDTAAAVAAVPFEEDGIFISLGTWALVGVELDQPLINEETFRRNFTNEGGVGGKIRFLKNKTGMWILEECNRQWNESYEKIVEAARSTVNDSYIDPDDPVFSTPGDMCSRIVEYLTERGQRVPEDIGGFARLIFESEALSLAHTIKEIEELTGREYEVVHVVGGASRNELLCSMISSASGKIVKAGPVEATAVGNALVQFMALGGLGSLEEAREVVRNSFDIREYHPQDEDLWRSKYERWREVVG